MRVSADNSWCATGLAGGSWRSVPTSAISSSFGKLMPGASSSPGHTHVRKLAFGAHRQRPEGKPIPFAEQIDWLSTGKRQQLPARGSGHAQPLTALVADGPRFVSIANWNYVLERDRHPLEPRIAAQPRGIGS